MNLSHAPPELRTEQPPSQQDQNGPNPLYCNKGKRDLSQSAHEMGFVDVFHEDVSDGHLGEKSMFMKSGNEFHVMFRDKVICSG